METLIGTYIFICLLFLFLCLPKPLDIQYNKPNLFFVVATFTILLFVHCAVEFNSVEDLWSYESRFQEAAKMDLNDFNDAFRTKEYVFNYFSKAISYISTDFRLFIVIYNIILFTIYYCIFMKYSANPSISIICLVLTVYFQSIFVLRQHLAIAILLLTIPFIIKRKIIPFLTLCILSFFTHMSSMIWIPVYFIYGISRRWVYIITMPIIAFIISGIGTYLNDISLLIEADYSSYIDSVSSISWTKKLIYIVYLIIYAITLNSSMFETGINKFTTTLLSLCTIGYLFAPKIELVDRMLTYYSISLIFAIPLVWYYLQTKTMKNIFIILVMLLQGYVSTQTLFADYYKNFKLESLNIIYIILCIISAIFIYKIYSYNFKLKTK